MDLRTLKNAMVATANKLPLFQQVEYLESTGTQYIDTGSLPVAWTYIYMDFQLTERTKFIVGSRDTYNTNAFCFGSDSGQWFFNYNTQYYWKGTEDLNKHHLEFLSNMQFIDGTLMGWTNYYDANWTKTIHLFGIQQNTGMSLGKCKIYNCRIEADDIKKRNFICVYNNYETTNVKGEICPPGTLGLYDTYHDKFYTNEGTGTFLAGSVI